MEVTVEARHEHNLHHVIAHMQTICTVQSVWLESVGFPELFLCVTIIMISETQELR